MSESKQVLESDETFSPFAGVRFLLLGFDSAKKEKILSRLLTGGGIDAVNYGPDCTHVIVDKLVCDDPVCVIADREGKTLVTGLWVDHSFDVGIPVDPAAVIYRPVKDFNGISGAQSMIICLTGYQRQDREDIMTMVGLMGANFSKPLVASKVTHLICYKFEGEKYELAKKIKKIKLVNHRWLEDCLKAWEILPESDYSKSGYELEMEVEAKDSQEETEDVASIVDTGKRNMFCPEKPLVQDKISHQSLLNQETLAKSLCLTESRNWRSVGNGVEAQSTSGKEIYSDNIPLVQEKCPMDLDIRSSFSSKSHGKMSTLLPTITSTTTMISEKVASPVSTADAGNNFPFVSKSCNKSDDRNVSRKSSLPLRSERTEANSNPSSSPLDKILINSGFNMELEKHPHGIDFGGLETPTRGAMLLPEKRQTAISPDQGIVTPKSGVSFSPKFNRDSKTSMASEPAAKSIGEVVSGSSFDGPCKKVDEVSTTKDQSYLRKNTPRTPEYALSMSKTAILKDKQEHKVEAVQHSNEEGQRSLSNSHRKNLALSPTKYSLSEVEMHQNAIPGVEPVSPGTDVSRFEKSKEQTGMDCSKVMHSNPQVKPLKKKMLVKKTLGSRPSIFKGNAEKHDGSTNLVKVVPQDEVGVSSERAKAKDNLQGSLKKIAGEDRPSNDEIKAPQDKEEIEFNRANNEDKSVEVGASDLGCISPGKRAGINNNGKRSRAKPIRSKEKSAKLREDKCIAEVKQGKSSEKLESPELICAAETREEILANGKKHSLRKTKGNKLKVPQKEANKNEPTTRQNELKSMESNEDTVILNCKNNVRSLKKFKRSPGAEKENEPVTDRHQDPRGDKLMTEPLEKCGQPLEVKTEPARFILSGHKLQRKEFQKVIKQLKGKACRDSHHWSYDATHFIVPSPIRRTEKFFAAAASGSWILTTDYLTASNAAGKLLPEEPFEWHKKCLSEDGAINLEAPRKWRQLKERTGHGAFHGMRVVVYGECIAPSLDTMKRVIKAGDGNVLATSPPYTRFLQSRIDFAIISPGMPYVDIWVQEFLRREIPCVVSDYLVEYICKPGYSLERHVQYGTHAWAKKSLANLVGCVEDVVEDPRTPVASGAELKCSVCGSGERGEELLICGDESGDLGCGAGTHIDCLDPPLADVPEEDWFCDSCCKKRDSSKSVSQVSNKRSAKRKKIKC